MTFEYGGCTFNLLDTPGHEDFSEDTYRTLTAVDSAVMVIDAAKGIETQTRKLFEVCRLRDVPIITFINKIDREGRDPFELLDEIERRARSSRSRPPSWPIGMGQDFLGCYDLLRDQLDAAGPRRRATMPEEVVDCAARRSAARRAAPERGRSRSCARRSRWSRGALPAVRPRGATARGT